MASRALTAFTLHLLVGGVAGLRAQEEHEFPTSALKAAGALVGAGNPYADTDVAQRSAVGLHSNRPGEMPEEKPKVRMMGEGTYHHVFTAPTSPWSWDTPMDLAYKRHLANNPSQKEEHILRDINADAERQGADEPKAAANPKARRVAESAKPRPVEPSFRDRGAKPAAYFKPKNALRDINAEVERAGAKEPKGAEMPTVDRPLARAPPPQGGGVGKGPPSGDERPWSNAPWTKRG